MSAVVQRTPSSLLGAWKVSRMPIGNAASIHVLVVEDDPVLRAVIVDYLEDAGCLVFESGTAERAISLCKLGLSIDAVFTDVHLRSTLTGWDVGEAARCTLGDVPVIYASGGSVERARPVAGSVFFNKPYEPADILRACRTLCNAQRTGSMAS
jgi:CheY-like chemotaxis protein